ncbi:patatin, partial [Bacillus thuringiensis]
MVHHILQIIVCLLFLNKFLHLKEVNIMVCIPSIVHQKASPKVYKTPHHPHFIILAK